MIVGRWSNGKRSFTMFQDDQPIRERREVAKVVLG